MLMYRRMWGGLCFKQSARQNIRTLPEGRIGRRGALKQLHFERDLRHFTCTTECNTVNAFKEKWVVIASRLQRYSALWRTTRKSASHWFPRQKVNGSFSVGFWIIAEDNLWGKQTFMILLFSKIIFTKERHVGLMKRECNRQKYSTNFRL